MNKKITLIQILPNNFSYEVCFTYESKKQNKNDNLKGFASIDLGMRNLFTIYDPDGEQKIIRGSRIKSINHYFNQKIDKLKSHNKKEQNKKNKESQNNTAKSETTYTSKRLTLYFRKRTRQINAEINKIVDAFYSLYKNKKEIIVGYNEQWKTGVNLGKINNRNFYEIPYSRILWKLKEKLSSTGTKLTTVEESYTSKCDGLKLEKVGRHATYSGNRISRGLFLSGNGKVINADLNGAINIMRKKKVLKEITGDCLYNPKKIHI